MFLYSFTVFRAVGNYSTRRVLLWVQSSCFCFFLGVFFYEKSIKVSFCQQNIEINN